MFKKLSPKQVFMFVWWRLPKYKDFKRVILVGAVRTLKTDGGGKSFIEWSIESTIEFKHDRPKGYSNFLLVGTTRENIKENAILPIMDYLEQEGYYRCYQMLQLTKSGKYRFYKNETMGILYVKYETHILKYRYMGANNKLAVKRIQGKTLRGYFIDEGALIDEEIHDTIDQRCLSFDGNYKGFITSNPEGGQDHWFYRKYVKGKMYVNVFGKMLKNNLVISFVLLDNPNFTAELVERLKNDYTDNMYRRKVLGEWIKGIGGIYTKLDRKKHVKPLHEILANNRFGKFTIGGDIGATDATTFTFTGITTSFDFVAKLKHYYHKNSETSEKDINDYVVDFFNFANKCHDLVKRPIEVYIDSADKQFRQLVVRGRASRGYNWLLTGNSASVNKVKENIKSSSAIKERMDFDNVLFGTNSTAISDGEDCKPLVNAYEEAMYNDKGDRLDNGTTNIDSLDSSEYSTKRYIGKIMSVLSRRKQVL